MKNKRKSITLIEILIVIALIAIIGSALAVNMRGSLDKGRAFKTEQNIERIREILLLEKEAGYMEADEIVSEWKKIVEECPIVKGKDIIKDGWGGEFSVRHLSRSDDFKITSKKFDDYKSKHESYRKAERSREDE